MSSFLDIIGRDTIKQQLEHQLSKSRVSHSYIFEGPKSSGKRTIASAFAHLLLCENPNKLNVCNECKACLGYKEIYVLEKEKTISVEDIRMLIEDTVLKPLSGSRKIYIIADADNMTEQAQNAFLKTLEDPPSYAHFILTASNTELLIDTIRSRAMILYTGVNSDKEVLKYLMDKYPEKPVSQLKVAAAFCEGSIGYAKSLLEDENFFNLRDLAAQYIVKLNLKENIKDITDSSYLFISFIQSILRDVLVFKHSNEQSRLINTDMMDIIKGTAGRVSVHNIYAAYDAAVKAVEYIKDNVPPAMALNMMDIELSEELS